MCGNSALAEPVPSPHRAAAAAVEAFAALISGNREEGVAHTHARLTAQDLSERAQILPAPTDKPAARFLQDCMGEISGLSSPLAANLEAISAHFCWRQSSGYTDAVLGEGFSANYCWAEIIGPNGFFRGDDFLFGLLILGPGRDYIAHYHPAPELYVPLTAGAFWQKGSEGLTEKPAGAMIWHPSMMVHRMVTRQAPLIAAWCWTERVATPAALGYPPAKG